MFRFFFLVALCVAGFVAAQNLSWKGEWPDTDFSRTSVSFDEIKSGGVGKDGIPAIDRPKFKPATSEKRIQDREPVMVLKLSGQRARAYPIRYLIWHEIVNDRIGGRPVAVTYCPLCNSGVFFDRRVKGRVLDFGVTGQLRHSDMIMFDRQSESWWQQFTGEAIVGAMTGHKLKKLPGWTESFGNFKTQFPKGLVMIEPRSSRPYGKNPYAFYDRASRPFLYDGENPPHNIDPLARVVVIGDRAWPLARVARAGVLKEAGVIIRWQKGTASALDQAQISKGRDVGSIRVESASSGKEVPYDVSFAFAFHAFFPKGKWMLGQ